jgi:predicted lipid carrier protein YhbT
LAILADLSLIEIKMRRQRLVYLPLDLAMRRARIEAVPPGPVPEADTHIRAPLLDLFDLVIGDDDGDARFFTRMLRF